MNALPLAAFVGMLMAVTGCASPPLAPTSNLEAARQAIATAERLEAGQYAAAELGQARARLASADAAVTEEKMVVAARFADEARADAELASAKTGTVKAKTVNDEMRRSTETLIEEMRRNSGGGQ
jgi:hypothetical protein